MRKSIVSAFTVVLLGLSHMASAVELSLELVAHNQRSSSGTLSTLKWAGPDSSPVWTCDTFTTTNPCINPGSAVLAGMGITPSTAVWKWNPDTQVLSMTGAFNTASTLGSSGAAAASAVIGDKVVDMVIDTVNDTTTAASYVCAEGNFLAGVGANGCANVNTGDNFTYEGSIVYNVGGDANCVQRTIGGDDFSTGNVRTLANTPGGGGCDPGDGAFNLWTVVSYTPPTGPGEAEKGLLIVSNGVDTAVAGTNYLTFNVLGTPPAPEAVDDGPYTALQGVPVILGEGPGHPERPLANDTLFTDPVTVEITTAPTKGTAVVLGSPGNQADISIEYTADVDAEGEDSFVYTVTDADGTTQDSATVTLNVLAFGANDDTGTTTRNVAININVGANDVGFVVPVTITVNNDFSAGGSATAPAAGPAASASISYTPSSAAGTPGYTETFTYQIVDANEVVDTATVTVTVNNTVPVAGNTTLNISTAGAAPASVSGNFNAGTLAGNSLGNTPSTVIATNGSTGTTGVSGNVVTYTPAATFFKGSDEFTYTITDSDPEEPETATGTVTVTIADVSPVLADRTITTTAGTVGTVALSITAGNGSVAQHTLAVSSQATNGTCALSGTNVSYTPADAAFTGADSCEITITDENGAGQSDTATISVTVNAAPSGGGGGGGLLPGGSSSTDAWTLALLGVALWLRRRLALRSGK